MDLAEALSGTTRNEDEADGRIYGFLYGRITNADDPKGLGRVKARIGAQGAREESDWLTPLWPGAIEGTANKNDPIVVAFIDGDPTRGLFAMYPETTTNGRATESMLLGSTFLRLYNDLVDKVKHHTHLPGSFSAFTYNVVGVSGEMIPPYPGSALAADRSTPSPLTADTVVLSGKAKVKS